jgi:serine/threonine-protein kinase
LIDKEDMIQRFFDEARKQARLEHPNIVPIYSLNWDAEVPFFVMKFVDGFSVEDVLQARGALPISVVQHLLSGTIAALQYAHDEGVIHRDVKPGNVLIDRRGQPVVSDFGIAKAAESPHLTQTGAAIGTPTYMSPEQCRGLPVTPASDQYSVGVLAFHLLAGSTPFSGSMLDLLQAHAVDAPPSITEQCPDCPPRLAAAVMRMLEKSPDDRWPELRDALPDISAGMGSEADARRQLVALFPDKPTAAESLPLTPRSPTPASSKSRKKSSPVINLIVAPSNGSWELSIGETVRMTVRRSGDTGAGQSTARVVWETSDEDVATVTADGEVTATGPGPVRIIATEGQLTGRCELTVVAVGETPRDSTALLHRPTAAEHATPTVPVDRAPPEGGATEIVLPPERVERSVAAAPAVPPPQAKRGSRRTMVFAVAGLAVVAAIALYATRDRAAPPTASPTAALKPDSAVAPVDTTPVAAPVTTPVPTAVAAPTAARVSLQLTRTTLRVGDSARATARAFDSTGTRMPSVPVALTSSAPRIVKVDSVGRMVAIATGKATITARSGSVGASETVTVDERLLPLSVADASDALKPLLVLASDERWGELQNILKLDVLDAFKSKRGIDASLSGEPRIVNSGIESATVDFDVTMRWVNFARLGRSGQAPLRATFVRSGQGWHVTEIVARDKLP